MVLGIRKFPGSNFGPKTAYYERGFSDSPNSDQEYVGVISEFRQRPLPPSFE
jgi:hypothetical protein